MLDGLDQNGVLTWIKNMQETLYIITRILNYCSVSSLVQYLFKITFMLKCLLREGKGKKKVSLKIYY